MFGGAGNNTEGPSYDHTQSNKAGHYAFLHAADHKNTARSGLYATPASSSDGVCMDFWYHMDGSNSKKLTLQAEVGAKPIGRTYFFFK